jgi:hypothetical protein
VYNTVRAASLLKTLITCQKTSYFLKEGERMRKRKFFTQATSFLLVASMLLSTNGVATASASVQTTDTYDESVVKISSVKDFMKIADDLDGDYILTKDLDFSGKDYTPIGGVLQRLLPVHWMEMVM